MSLPLKFLLIDDNADSRMLLAKTLARKYPHCAVLECHQGEAAVRLVEREKFNAVVAHRTFDFDGETLIALLRRANPEVPIVMVSGYNRSARARAAGADAFLNYDRWLQLGTVVAEAIAARLAAGGGSTAPFSATEPDADAVAG
jgi:CheY-like chemotaxis protein